jgi:putative heme-binding domain-containing protein
LPRRLLFEFPDHTWVNDIEIRGDDLYVVTVSAVYRIPGGRVKREALKPERLLWGVPNGHVHQCFHACAWGPEGDLYVSMGDPVWYYGDFSRPDHWGHWTMFYKRGPEADAQKSTTSSPTKDDRQTNEDPLRAKIKSEWASMAYNGVGAVFRIRPDGTDLRSFARGLRNPCGLCFDNKWNLFTNDNDHEGIPALYTPGRLIHVTEGSYWSWPRGWTKSRTPDRADLLPMVNDEMGRAVPVLQTYYADGYLGEKYENNLLVTRWCRRTVSRFPLEAKGVTFIAKEHVLLEGRDQARPVGICVGRGGRVFVTICYMAQNEGSPTYRSDLAVITRKDDTAAMQFHAYDATTASLETLLNERNEVAHSRWTTAFEELKRRSEQSPDKDPDPRVLREPVNYAALALLPGFVDDFVKALSGELERNPNSFLEAVRSGKSELGLDDVADPRACLNCAEYRIPNLVRAFNQAPEWQFRMAAVLSAGFRLTVPPVDARLPAEAPLAALQKEESNVILFADETQPIDLRKLGRVGIYTIAEHWKALEHTDEQEQLFALLMGRLDDDNDRVRLQAAHFLSLLNDPRSEPKIAKVVSAVQDRRLDVGKLEPVKPSVWMIGPIPDADGLKTVHPIETSPIDLSSNVTIAGKTYSWKETKPTSPDRPLYDFRELFGLSPKSSAYSHFRFDSPTAARMQLLVGSEDGVKVWQNGKLVHHHDVIRPLIQLDDVVPLDLQPGSNDILVRVAMKAGRGGQYLHFRHLGDVRFSIPEKPDGMSLAERLKSNTGTAIDPRFVNYDWQTEVKSGDVVRGRKLFGAESLGCVKCHAATATQAGGGGPSLADAGKRFTVQYLVESVLLPSKVISPVFKATVIATTDGRVFTGLIIAETADKVELLLPDTKKVSIDKTQIDERKPADVSAMPVGLVKTPEELRDVIAYLLSNPAD